MREVEIMSDEQKLGLRKTWGDRDSFHGKVHSVAPGRVYGHEGRRCDMENKIL